VIAALCITPERNRVHLYFRLHSDANINALRVSDFLIALKRQLRKRIVLVWDRFLPHRAATVQCVILNRHIHSYFLPPYAPELNPVEHVWGYLKINPLANLTAIDVDALTETTRSHGRSIQRKQHLLRSFVNHVPLSLRLK
jgi:transposase